jgi:hypothetical protein
MENNGQTTFSPCTLLRNPRNDDRQMKIAGTTLPGTQAVAPCAAHTRKTWSVPLFTWLNNMLHGADYQWELNGKLRDGYPKYWVKGKEVSKAEYLSKVKTDSRLSPVFESNIICKRNYNSEIINIITGEKQANMA